ncbi:hypothetical protein EYF80_049336 [Liparis tanakae]|uniref:Uncharacterized protein n=1 Tax=Liparis tanakae TaxID=230148 RepID=A0A4Z2FH47_9TELE|nr:hypothetical protein EYF80_049336 [Liparis tanakae]
MGWGGVGREGERERERERGKRVRVGRSPAAQRGWMGSGCARSPASLGTATMLPLIQTTSLGPLEGREAAGGEPGLLK